MDRKERQKEMKNMGLKEYGFDAEKMENMLGMLDFIQDLKVNLKEEVHPCTSPHPTLELFRVKHKNYMKGEFTKWHWRDIKTKMPLNATIPQHFCIYCMEDLPEN